MRDVVGTYRSLTFVPGESQTIGGLGRNDRFAYTQRLGAPGEVVDRVLESGTASGREPTTEVQLSSYIGQFLRETGVSLGAEDEAAFPMRWPHFRRTFAEKLFAIHGRVELLKREGQPLGTYARHYYDLFRLAGREEVMAMLQSVEYDEIKLDYDCISRAHFARNYFYPQGMRFS